LALASPFNAGEKTATFVASLAETGVKCAICGALPHRNSMHTDHKMERSKGGGAHVAALCNERIGQTRLQPLADELGPRSGDAQPVARLRFKQRRQRKESAGRQLLATPAEMPWSRSLARVHSCKLILSGTKTI
jgi:hypothetical protein